MRDDLDKLIRWFRCKCDAFVSRLEPLTRAREDEAVLDWRPRNRHPRQGTGLPGMDKGRRAMTPTYDITYAETGR